jgi:hypothetical protein
MSPSTSQVNFFDKLLDEKQFPDKINKDKLREQFAELNQKSASAWIEAAIGLPKIDESGEAVTPPPFMVA